MDPLFTPRQWAAHRQRELTRLDALFATARANGVEIELSAPEGHRCDFCGGLVVNGVCPTCESPFVEGIRVPRAHDAAEGR